MTIESCWSKINVNPLFRRCRDDVYAWRRVRRGHMMTHFWPHAVDWPRGIMAIKQLCMWARDRLTLCYLPFSQFIAYGPITGSLCTQSRYCPLLSYIHCKAVYLSPVVNLFLYSRTFYFSKCSLHTFFYCHLAVFRHRFLQFYAVKIRSFAYSNSEVSPSCSCFVITS